jgi:protein-S-isoprenylcysteine O-methyltransferase Ste14
VVPNWLVGPSYAVAVLLLVALRLKPEEQMMLEKFGRDYEVCRTTTERLIPGIW